MRWLLDVSDAGPSQLRFVALAHAALEPGCGATTDNPRPRVTVSGVQDYLAHAQGRTTFEFDPRHFSCGRVQVDVSAFDAQGHESLLIGMVVNYGTVCQAPPPVVPPPVVPPVIVDLQCTPPTQTIALNQTITLTATGGNGVYAWTVPGTPSVDSRATLTTSFSTAGEHRVAVTSAGLTATCLVIVQSPPPPVEQLTCTPVNSTVLPNQVVQLHATGGTGTYAWSAPAGSPATGDGAAFSTVYGSAGFHTVVVTSGPMSASCTVTVNPPPPVTELVCAPNVVTVTVGQPVTVRATGGNGTYAWSAPGGTPSDGAGSSFTTRFDTAGDFRIWVRSAGLEAKCKAEVMVVPVPPPPAPPVLVCGPRVTDTVVGQPVTTQASGGTGTYAWSASAGTPATGTGALFTTTFTAIGGYDVIVTSGNQTARCKVEVGRVKETQEQ